MEQWKKIEGYENYSVSTKGRVRNDKFNREVKTTENLGYLYVTLFPGRKKMRVHRLVATAFIPNPDNLPYVNHKNEIKHDNRVDNLEWCTPEYNVNYGNGIRLMLDNRQGVFAERRCLIDGIEYKSVSEACRALDLKRGCVSMALWKGQTQYKGHSISYIT